MAAAFSGSLPLIARDPAILGGEPVVRGTRVPVRTIAIIVRLYHTRDAVRAAYPMLSPKAIDEALAYYGAHWAEIERLIAENEDGGSE